MGNEGAKGEREEGRSQGQRGRLALSSLQTHGGFLSPSWQPEPEGALGRDGEVEGGWLPLISLGLCSC